MTRVGFLERELSVESVTDGEEQFILDIKKKEAFQAMS